MRRLSASLLFLVLGCCSCGVGAQESHEPLRQTRLLALVAGAALPENIVAAIHDRGVSFQPDFAFRTQLETVGADPRILAALDAARVVVPDGAKQAPTKEELEHIFNAAKLIQSKKFPEGATELTAVLKAAFEGAESGFVMGQMLRLQERWIAGAWGTSDNNRKAKFYSITKAGRKQLNTEAQNWERISSVIGRVLLLAGRG